MPLCEIKGVRQGRGVSRGNKRYFESFFFFNHRRPLEFSLSPLFSLSLILYVLFSYTPLDKFGVCPCKC